MSERFHIEIPRWGEFQHYKDRTRPTWIKDYTRQLDDEAYLELSPAQRGVLGDLRKLYAVTGGEIPTNLVTISRRFGYKVSRRTLEALNHAGFITLTSIGTSRGGSDGAVQIRTVEVEGEEEKDQPQGPTVVPIRGKARAETAAERETSLRAARAAELLVRDPELELDDEPETLGGADVLPAFLRDLDSKRRSA